MDAGGQDLPEVGKLGGCRDAVHGAVGGGQRAGQAEHPPRSALQQRQHVGSVEALQHQAGAGVAVHDVEQPRRDTGAIKGFQGRRLGAVAAEAGAVQLEHRRVAAGVHVCLAAGAQPGAGECRTARARSNHAARFPAAGLRA